MLETLLSAIVTALMYPLSSFIESFMTLLGFSIDKFVYYFPAASDLYGIMRGIALGLAIGIALFNLLKFFVGPLAKVGETPVWGLARCFIAIIFIYFGGYILEFVVDLFKGPYSSIVIADSSTKLIETFTMMANEFTSQPPENKILAAAGYLSGAELGNLLIALIVLIALGINLLKLLLEMVERYVMLGVLVFTGPLGWSTLASQSTMNIFSRWVNMFISQCIMLLFSAWTVKLFVSTLQISPENSFIIKGIFALAFTRAAQRFDSYLQQLGLNPATTSGNLFDELLATGKMLSGMIKGGGSKGGSGGSDPVLGGDPTGFDGSRGSLLGFGLIGAGASMAKNIARGASVAYTSERQAGHSVGAAIKAAARQGGTNAKASAVSSVAGKYTGAKIAQDPINKAATAAGHGDMTLYNKLPQASKDYIDANNLIPVDAAAKAAAQGDMGIYNNLPQASKDYIAENKMIEQYGAEHAETTMKSSSTATPQETATIGKTVQNFSDMRDAADIDMQASEENFDLADTVFAASLISAGGGADNMANQFDDDPAMTEFVNTLDERASGKTQDSDIGASVSLNRSANPHGWTKAIDHDGRKVEGVYTSRPYVAENGQTVHDQYAVTVMTKDYVDHVRSVDRKSPELEGLRPIKDRAGNVSYVRFGDRAQIPIDTVGGDDDSAEEGDPAPQDNDIVDIPTASHNESFEEHRSQIATPTQTIGETKNDTPYVQNIEPSIYPIDEQDSTDNINSHAKKQNLEHEDNNRNEKRVPNNQKYHYNNQDAPVLGDDK